MSVTHKYHSAAAVMFIVVYCVFVGDDGICLFISKYIKTKNTLRATLKYMQLVHLQEWSFNTANGQYITIVDSKNEHFQKADNRYRQVWSVI